MKHLRFIYHMALHYDPPIRAQRFTLRCVLSTTQTQRIDELTVRAEPHVFMSRGRDGLGNAYSCQGWHACG